MKIGYLWAAKSSRVVGNSAEAVHVQSMCRAFQRLGHQVFIVSGELEKTEKPLNMQCPFPLTVIPSPNPLPITSWLYRWISNPSTPQSARELAIESSRPVDGYAPARRPRLVWRDLERRLSAWRYQHHFFRLSLPMLAQERPDVFYQRYTRYGLLGIWLAKNLHIPLILEMNASLTQPQEWFRQHSPIYPWIIERTERYICRHATAVVLVSAMQVPYLRKLGVRKDRIAVMSNAVDLEIFRPDDQAAQYVKQRYGLVGKFVVGFVGSMRHWHDVESLLEGVRLAAQSRRDIYALIVGDGPARPMLESQVEEMGLSDRIIFSGYVPHQDIVGFIESMDATVVLSPFGADFWCSPIKLFEYMAMGKPVIASRSGQLADIIKHRKNGILVDPQNPPQVAEAILELANDADLRELLGRAARRTVETTHTWEHNAQAVIDLYERLGAK